MPSTLQEEYQWSQSGLQLLSTIQHIIAKSGGSERLANLIDHERARTYICMKPDCAYCSLLNRQIKEDQPEATITLPASLTHRGRNYSKDEIKILHDNNHLPDSMLSNMLNRSVSSIKSARHKFVRQQYRFPYNWRRWS